MYKAIGEKRINFAGLLFYVLFAFAAILVFWKCRYGYASLDEAFYPTIPYRLFLGDSLFYDEWHLSQMSGVIMYPFISLYVLLKGSLDGMILTARYMWAALQCCAGLFLYYRMKKYTETGAALAAVCFTLFSPFGIMYPSYYAMGNLFLLVCLILLLTTERKIYIQCAVAGIFLAAAVLCNPYIIFIYLVYAFLVFVNHIAGKYGRTISGHPVLGLDIYIYISIGAVAIAVIFLGFVFSRTTVAAFLEALPAIFADPEHSYTFSFKVYKYFQSIANACGMVSFAIYVLFSGLFCLCLLDKKRIEHKEVYFSLASALTLSLMVVLFSKKDINFPMWSINVLALFIFLISYDKRIKEVFFILWLPGMAYSFCANLSSNDHFYSISAASAVASVGSIIMLLIFVGEEIKGRKFRKKLMCTITVFILLFQLSSQAYLRYKLVFWDNDIELQNYLVKDGVEAGLIVSRERYDSYYQQLKSLPLLSTYSPEKVLYLSDTTWFYLAHEYEFACYSAWLSGVNETTIERLKLFYLLNPQKIPDAVYCERQYQPYAERFCEEFGYKADIYKDCIILVPE